MATAFAATPRRAAKSPMLPMILLIGWVLLGPLLGILYGIHISAQDWQIHAAATAMQEGAQHGSDIVLAGFTYFCGGVVWMFGLLGFGLLAWNRQVPPRG